MGKEGESKKDRERERAKEKNLFSPLENGIGIVGGVYEQRARKIEKRDKEGERRVERETCFPHLRTT